MSLAHRLMHLDRRFIFLVVLAVIIVPYVRPLGLPIRVSREARSFFHAIERVHVLEYLHVACGTGTLPTASVKIRTQDQIKQAAACGDGPIDAAYEAIRDATGLSPKLENYSIRAVTGGKEALGEATVRISENSRTFTGRGISTDIIEASAKAYVDAINRMVSAQNKDRPLEES